MPQRTSSPSLSFKLALVILALLTTLSGCLDLDSESTSDSGGESVTESGEGTGVETGDESGGQTDNDPYTVITAPADDTQVTLGDTVTVTVDAYHPDDVVVARLWINGDFYAMDNTAPFSFTVNDLAEGDHSLMVRTRDVNGGTLDSEPVTLTVAPPQEPYTRITSPSAGVEVNENEAFTVTAEAFDPDGVSATRLWINDNYYSLDSSAPYRFTVDGLAPGNHTLMVRSRNVDGNTLDSDPVTIAVRQARPDDSSDNDDEASDGLITLPIEVLGPAGTRESVTFNINDPSNISHLYLRCNTCGYHDIRLDQNTNKVKATVRVNGGRAIPLKHFIENGRVYGNEQIEIIGGEADYGGIGGGFRTVRMTVPVSGLQEGANKLTFEHLDAEAPSIGFRILELNLLESGDLSRKVLSDSLFVDDDPRDWTSPRNSSADIAEGRDLWHARDSLYDPWVDNLDGQGNGRGPLDGQLRASCADCHASDGRDLQYFNFSNRSIVERSRFHDLSEEAGEKIASYIRSLDIPVVDNARPWHPAYQPGPGLDSRPAYEWAAGAGVDAILDEDRDMAPYLFPNGTSLNAVRNVVDRYDTLNFRELPINIPMPEWNQWLPIIHPDDAFDTANSAIRSDHRGNNVGMPYYERLYRDAVNNPTRQNIGYLASRLGTWLRRGGNCEGGAAWRAINGNAIEASLLPMPSVNWNSCNSIEGSDEALEMIEIAKRGLSAWSSVKMWEIVHSNDLEQESLNQGRRVCSDDRCIDASEPRGWVVDGRNVFDRPPHFTGTGPGRKYFTQNPMLGILESNSWYHLNMILNPGYRETMPSHFAYTYSHVELLQRFTGIDQGYRFWATMIKQRQLQTNGEYGVEAGLDLRTAQPYVYFGTARNRTNTDTQSNVGQPLWGRLAQTMVEDFVADANNATAQDWANATQNRRVQDRYSTDFEACSGTCTFDLGRFQGRNTYRVIPELRRIGVSDRAIDDLIDWGETTWPNGPWHRVR